MFRVITTMVALLVLGTVMMAGPVYGSEDTAASTKQESRRILYYRNPMGLPDTSPVPKKDGMGMDYIPVYAEETGGTAGEVKVSPQRLQELGVRLAPVQHQILQRSLRLFGTLAYDENRLTAVTPRFDGYVQEILAGLPGETVKAGQPLLQIYSPEIWRHALELRRYAGTGQETAVRTRLRSLGIAEGEINRLARGEAPTDLITWPAPTAGTIIERNVIRGQGFTAGQTLYRLADLSSLWVIAQVFAADLSAVQPGQKATITTEAYPEQTFTGEVKLVLPELDAATRTARVRIEVANPDGLLKPGLYAEVTLAPLADAKPVITIPESALLDDGERQSVLVALGEGRFAPRSVRTGIRVNGQIEIISGLQHGEQVVSSATFLIDAESDIRAALEDLTALKETP